MSAQNITLGLVNPKSPTNVGAIMRAAGCFGVDEVRYTGERYRRAARFHTDTKNQTLNIPLTGVDDLLAQVPEGAAIVCVDLVEGAIPLPEFKHPARAFYIFGPEDGSLSQALVDAADSVVYIPTRGCLNLAASVNVVLYDRSVKLPQLEPGDELIRQSRDTNNKVKVNND